MIPDVPSDVEVLSALAAESEEAETERMYRELWAAEDLLPRDFDDEGDESDEF
jgi:hypothetical protein